MNLRRQLLLVSLLTLVLPWAGCQFIRETETALREGQQNMLGGTAQAIADSLSQFPGEFFASGSDGRYDDSQIYGHPLAVEPLIDGYTVDWTSPDASQRSLRGADGDIRFRSGIYGRQLFLAIDVPDGTPVYAANASDLNADRVIITSLRANGERLRYLLTTEAPGLLIGRRADGAALVDESRIQAFWLDTTSGYRIEARIPLELLGDRLGFTVINERGSASAVRSSTFSGDTPGRLITVSPVLTSVIRGYARPDLRLIVTDAAGWRLAVAGGLAGDAANRSAGQGWLRRIYSLLLEQGDDARFAEPDPLGRERQSYVQTALGGEADSDWFRSTDTGRSVVAVAQPVWSGNVQTGAVILQQGTAEILSLTNAALGRLINVTLIATLLVALTLIGYASWLSLRIRRLSRAAERSLDVDPETLELPSASSGDEIGDLSRSFARVLRQLGQYNEYLRTLASKLSHELRTPLTIVSSSLENLEHETLSEDAASYTARARDGAARLKKILDAMSEASRVEELMQTSEPEPFDLCAALASAAEAYALAWPDRRFRFTSSVDAAPMVGSPELVIQLLDKLVDNAISFSESGDEITMTLEADGDRYRFAVRNPGPPLPARMRQRLFDSMVSLRSGDPGEHLGLGLYISRLVAEGHGGSIEADNVDGGVEFRVHLPAAGSTTASDS